MFTRSLCWPHINVAEQGSRPRHLMLPVEKTRMVFLCVQLWEWHQCKPEGRVTASHMFMGIQTCVFSHLPSMFMLIQGAGVLLRMHKHTCVCVCLHVCVCCLILPSRRLWSPPEHSTSSEHTASWHMCTHTHTQIHSSLSQPCFWPSHIWGYMHPRHPTAQTKKGVERMRTEEKNKEMRRRKKKKKKKNASPETADVTLGQRI